MNCGQQNMHNSVNYPNALPPRPLPYNRQLLWGCENQTSDLMGPLHPSRIAMGLQYCPPYAWPCQTLNVNRALQPVDYNGCS